MQFYLLADDIIYAYTGFLPTISNELKLGALGKNLEFNPDSIFVTVCVSVSAIVLYNTTNAVRFNMRSFLFQVNSYDSVKSGLKIISIQAVTTILFFISFGCV